MTALTAMHSCSNNNKIDKRNSPSSSNPAPVAFNLEYYEYVMGSFRSSSSSSSTSRNQHRKRSRREEQRCCHEEEEEEEIEEQPHSPCSSDCEKQLPSAAEAVEAPFTFRRCRRGRCHLCRRRFAEPSRQLRFSSLRRLLALVVLVVVLVVVDVGTAVMKSAEAATTVTTTPFPLAAAAFQMFKTSTAKRKITPAKQIRSPRTACWNSPSSSSSSSTSFDANKNNNFINNHDATDHDVDVANPFVNGYTNGYHANGHTVNGHGHNNNNNKNGFSQPYNNNNNLDFSVRQQHQQRLHMDEYDEDDYNDSITVELSSSVPSLFPQGQQHSNGGFNADQSSQAHDSTAAQVNDSDKCRADQTNNGASFPNQVTIHQDCDNTDFAMTTPPSKSSLNGKVSSNINSSKSAQSMPAMTAPEVNRWILSKDMFAQAAQRSSLHRNGISNTNNISPTNGITTNSNHNTTSEVNDTTSLGSTTSATGSSTPGASTISTNNHNYNNRLHLLQHYPQLRDLTDDDRFQIDHVYWNQLLSLVSYLGTQMVAKIYNALMVAYRAHREQVRKSGEPFIIHPVEVAKLLAGLKMDGDTILAGLLHDTVEDTDMAFDQIEAMFGRVVRSIVEGETKVSKLPKLAFSNYADEQAENLRQMFVAMTDDYRIIIVKLADRLHNMRTLRFMKPEKQIKISRETLDIFAPLAHRMGIWQFKSELEDTAFMYLYPQEYKRLNKRLRQHQKKFRDTLDKSQDILQRTLDHDPTLSEQAQDVRVYGRTKEIYSLWQKMETKGEEHLDHIVDVVALRVIITPKGESTSINNRRHNSMTTPKAASATTAPSSSSSLPLPQTDRGVWLCYHVLGLVQHLPGFQPVPTRVKDYISFPKPNGYQSLHTALMLNGQTIEVQIRTNLMHQVAEYGMASHWAYTDRKKKLQQQTHHGKTGSSNNNNKDIKDSVDPNEDNDNTDDDNNNDCHCQMVEEELYNTPWLSSIKEWQDDIISSRDFVDSVRRELLGKRVFVFLRNGKILNLARGATAIDAAFAIHTEVGLAMHAVEINGKPMPFSYELRNGDVVSIMTGEGKPAVDWMRFAKSRSTRSKLRSYFRKKQKESLREAGRILLTDYLWMHGPLIERTSFLKGVWDIPATVDELANFAQDRLKPYESIDDLLIDIGTRHDRLFLHNVVATLFQVPEKVLIEAETNRRALVPPSVVVAVHENRQRAMDAGVAAETSDSEMEYEDSRHCDSDDSVAMASSSSSASTSLVNSFTTIRNATTQKVLHGLEGTDIEFADHEQMCEDCLPILGDEVVGTRPADCPDAVTTVHRLGCPHAQRAINQVNALKGISSDLLGRVNSVSLRNNKSSRYSSAFYGTKRSVLNDISSSSASRLHGNEIPVRLRWSDMPGEESSTFMTEIRVVAEDRKLLLSDCSCIVSQLSEIVKTGSATTQEHAVLVFLVRVSGLHHLQQLMDSLRQIGSVMSVERAFGSELL